MAQLPKPGETVRGRAGEALVVSQVDRDEQGYVAVCVPPAAERDRAA